MIELPKSDALADWQQEPTTQLLAKRLADERLKALQRLITVCHDSEDPDVCVALAEYRLYAHFEDVVAYKEVREK